jgi:hypothetical protein
MDEARRRQENQRKWGQIVAKAWMDPKFEKELIAHPEKVCKEYGIDSHGREIEVIQNTAEKTYYVLPTKPEGLTEADLRNINAASDACSGSSSLCG